MVSRNEYWFAFSLKTSNSGNKSLSLCRVSDRVLIVSTSVSREMTRDSKINRKLRKISSLERHGAGEIKFEMRKFQPLTRLIAR